MTLLIGKVPVLIASCIFAILFALVLSADTQAGTSADDIRKKGKQCIAWQNAALDVDPSDMLGCLNSCARLGEMVVNEPELLTDERIDTCNEVYFAVERQVAGEQSTPKAVVDQPPETIEEMVDEMRNKTQECVTTAENANTQVQKSNAEACANTCYRGALKISRGGVPVEQAKANWKMCIVVHNESTMSPRGVGDESTPRLQTTPEVRGESALTTQVTRIVHSWCADGTRMVCK